MPFFDLELTDDQKGKIKKTTNQAVAGVMVLTDGEHDSVREALKFISREDIKISAEDLVVMAVEGKLIGQAIMW